MSAPKECPNPEPEDVLSRFQELEFRHVPGIYLLYRGDELIYVGASSNVQARICEHAKRFEFDSAKYLRIRSRAARFALERYLIVTFQPELNTKSVPGKRTWRGRPVGPCPVAPFDPFMLWRALGKQFPKAAKQ